MARIRTIKPDLPLDEELAELAYVVRYVFALLPMATDKSGRVEDRPMMIKAKLLPYDDENMDAILMTLHEAGFITRYEEKGKRFIQVNTFVKHQRPHHTERPSEIPEPKELTKKGRAQPTGVTGRRRAEEDTDGAMEYFKEVAQTILAIYPKFNPYAFVNKKSQDAKWPIQCFSVTFEEMLKAEKSKEPHALAEHLWPIYSQNVMAELNTVKHEPMELPTELSSLIGGIGKEMEDE